MASRRGNARISSIIRALEHRFGKATEAAQARSGPASLDRLMCAVLGAGGSPDRGEEAVRKILGQFVDWNEVRVSSPTTVSESFAGVPGGPVRARRAAAFLSALFRKHKSIGLGFLQNATPADLRRFAAAMAGDDHVLQSAISLVAFGQPVVPPTPTLQRVCTRVGLCGPKATVLQCARRMQNACSAGSPYPLYRAIEVLADRICHDENPECSDCPLNQRCPSVKKFIRLKKAAEARRASESRAAAMAARPAARRRPGKGSAKGKARRPKGNKVRAKGRARSGRGARGRRSR